jgi:hypothetical protein
LWCKHCSGKYPLLNYRTGNSLCFNNVAHFKGLKKMSIITPPSKFPSVQLSAEPIATPAPTISAANAVLSAPECRKWK